MTVCDISRDERNVEGSARNQEKGTGVGINVEWVERNIDFWEITRSGCVSGLLSFEVTNARERIQREHYT